MATHEPIQCLVILRVDDAEYGPLDLVFDWRRPEPPNEELVLTAARAAVVAYLRTPEGREALGAYPYPDFTWYDAYSEVPADFWLGQGLRHVSDDAVCVVADAEENLVPADLRWAQEADEQPSLVSATPGVATP